MLTPDDAQFLTEAVAGVATPLHEGLDKGRLVAHEHFDKHGMKGTAYAKGRTDLTRDHARRHLEKLVDLGGWKLVNGTSGRIHLYNGTLTLKVLHGAPFGSTPAPGHNQARISYYRNGRLNLLGVQGSNLLAVWTNDPASGELSIRIVRPINGWKYGGTPHVDLDFVMPRSAGDFGEWQFIPDDEGMPLPFIFDEEEQREEGGSSGA